MRVNTARDFFQPIRPVPHGVHAGHNSQQCLRRADVRGCAVPSNMLLASLQSQAIRGSSFLILRHADNAPRHLPGQGGRHSHKRRMGPTEEKRHTEALRGTHRDVRAKLTRRHQKRLRQKVTIHRDQRFLLFSSIDQRLQVTYLTRRSGLGNNDADKVLLVSDRLGGDRRYAQRDTSSHRPRPNNRDHLRMAGAIQEHDRLPTFTATPTADHQLNGLRDGSGLIQQRRINDVEPG